MGFGFLRLLAFSGPLTFRPHFSAPIFLPPPSLQSEISQGGFTSLSLTPAFSPVELTARDLSRFNGFQRLAQSVESPPTSRRLKICNPQSAIGNPPLSGPIFLPLFFCQSLRRNPSN